MIVTQYTSLVINVFTFKIVQTFKKYIENITQHFHSKFQNNFKHYF